MKKIVASLFALLFSSVSLASKSEARSPADGEVTHKVYFDVSIDGKEAGRITMGLFGKDVPKPPRTSALFAPVKREKPTLACHCISKPASFTV